MSSPSQNRLKLQVGSECPGVQRSTPHSLSAYNGFREPGEPWGLKLSLSYGTAYNFFPAYSGSPPSEPLTFDSRQVSQASPCPQLPASSLYIWQTHILYTWDGLLHPAFHGEVLGFQLLSSGVFSFHERQDFLSCLEAKRLQIYLSIFTFTHLLTHPLTTHSAGYPFIHPSLHHSSISIHVPIFSFILLSTCSSSICLSNYFILDQRTTA